MKIQDKHIVIAVDGHSSCGKSTMAKQIAKSLNLLYVDSGAMYRAVTLYSMQHIDFSKPPIDTNDIIRLLPEIHIDFKKEKGLYYTFLNEENVENEIRQMEVSKQVSLVSAIPEVRKKLVKLQRQLSDNHNIIMDGRDIGTVVFPKADIKFFVTAEAKVRAERRYLELKEKGMETNFKSVWGNIIKRDEIDSNRETSPLIQARDAILIDNSNMNQQEQLEFALNLIKEKLK